jgi:hypothetical protein
MPYPAKALNITLIAGLPYQGTNLIALFDQLGGYVAPDEPSGASN